MNATQKTLLKNEIKLQLSKAKITTDNLQQIKRDERDDYIETKLLEVNDACLRWALKNNIVTQNELQTNKFYTENTKLVEIIASGTFLTGSGVAAASIFTTIATSTVTTSVAGTGLAGLVSSSTLAGWGLGSVATTVTTTATAITATTIAATAAPIALAGAGIYGALKYKQNKQNKTLIEYFENEKSKILSFYFNKINDMKSLENKNGTY